jgi:hypothetical protein
MFRLEIAEKKDYKITSISRCAGGGFLLEGFYRQSIKISRCPQIARFTEGRLKMRKSS